MDARPGTSAGARLPPAPRGASAFQVLLLIALWTASRPYMGIVHDARLYMVQALHALRPERFAADLYFAFGSQDAFTAFSALYAPLVGAVGPAAAHLLATALGHACWFGALLGLTRSMFDGRSAVLAAAAAITLNPHYGNLHIFSYGEPFATPRLFAEGAVMAALALALRGRVAAPALCLLGAAFIHPLMSLPGIGVFAVLLALRDGRLWLLYAVSAAGALALATAGVEPFSRALATFDDAWFETVFQRCAFGFMSRWTWLDVLNAAPAVTGLLMAWRLASAAERRLLWVVAAVAAGGVGATVLGADVARNVLAVNLQPWRALWLLTLVTNAWAAVVALRLPPGAASRHFLLVTLACNVVERWAGLVSIFSTVAFGAALLAFLQENRARRPLFRPLWLAGWVAVASAAVLLLAFLAFAWPARAEAVGAAGISAAAVVTAAALAALVLSVDRRWKVSAGAWCVGVALLLGAAAVADRRSEWQAFVEGEAVPQDLPAFVADAENVYWERGVDLLWLKLGRASHYSCIQGAGAMFFAGTAAEFRRRTDALSGLNTADFADDPRGPCALKRAPGEEGPATREQLESSCRALPELDALVLTRRVQGVPSTAWRAPVRMLIRKQEGGTTHHDTFHMYRCSDLR